MINTRDILETISMIQEENLDIRTITMGISLLDCCHSDIDTACTRVYDKITRKAEKLVKTGEDIEKEFGIPIIRFLRRRPCKIRQNPREGLSGSRSKFPRRIFRTCTERLCSRRYRAYTQYSRSSLSYRPYLFFRKHRLHKSRHQYGRRKAHG